MKMSWKNCEIEVIRGDITEQATQGIVNAANNHFWMGAGVAGAIKRKGGAAIEAEAVKKGPVAVGEAAVTGAGALKAKYVIHAAVMGQDLATDAGKIQRATINSLKRAEECGMESLSFPALGTGVGGFPFPGAAKVMMEATKSYLENTSSSLKKISYVLFQEEAQRAFEQAALLTFKSE